MPALARHFGRFWNKTDRAARNIWFNSLDVDPVPVARRCHGDVVSVLQADQAIIANAEEQPPIRPSQSSV
jgi:hypothetical protein